MASTPTNLNQPEKPKKQLTMEIRLLIAFLLMGLVLFLTPYIYKPPPPAKPAQPAKQAQAAKPVAPAAPVAAAKPLTAEAATTAPAPGQMQAPAEQLFTVDTNIYHIVFSNKGAVVQSWVLKNYKDRAGKSLDLVNSASLSKVPPPFALSTKDDKIADALNSGLYVAKPEPNGLGITYEFSDGMNYAKKTFQFTQAGYLTQVTTEVTHNGAPLDHLIDWRGGFGDAAVVNRAAERHGVYYDLGQNKLISKDAKSVKDTAYTASGNFSFAGLEDKYFAAVFLPKDNTSMKVDVVKNDVPIAPNAKDEAEVGVEVGGDSVNHLTAFVGPKDVDLLRNVDPKLQQLIDWGWYGIIAKPIFLAMHWLNDNLVHNYGWSIIVITVVINLIVLPMRFSSLRSQRKMQRLQPQIAAINAKYKGLSLRDPRKAQQNQEVMELYKKEGVNPLGGCLPMLIQLPVLYAFYKVLAVTIELRGAHWLWVTDLSQPETLAIRALPVILIVTQFIVQRMTPNPGMDPAQAKMMGFMPLMFGFLFYNASAGLVLYWLTSNVVGIVQQWMINKTMPPPPAPALKAAPKKRN